MLLTACSRSDTTLEDLLPKSAGTWRLENMRPLSPELVPSQLRSAGLRAAIRATYSGPGPGDCNVEVYDVGSQTSAFELVQKWRQSEHPALYSGKYFLITRASTTPLASDCARQLQRNFPASRKP